MLRQIIRLAPTLLIRNPARQLGHLAKPTLKNIFGEHHQDSATSTILNRLSPKIKNFKDETPASLSLNCRIESLQFYLDYYESLRKKYEFYHLDITNPDHFKLFTEKLSQDDPRGPLTTEEARNAYINIARHAASQSHMNLLKTFQKNKTSYTGMDLNLGKIPPSQQLLLTDTRDQLFVDALLNSNEESYARVGYGHFAGMQQKILEKLPFKIASASFNFFYVRSMHFVTKHHPIKLTQIGQLPLGYTDIDIRKTGEDQAIKIIEKHIKKKEEQLADITYEKQPTIVYDMMKR